MVKVVCVIQLDGRWNSVCKFCELGVTSSISSPFPWSKNGSKSTNDSPLEWPFELVARYWNKHRSASVVIGSFWSVDAKCVFAAQTVSTAVWSSFKMSEIRQWLAAIGIAGIERLSKVFEAQSFSSRKSLQYLNEDDLDYLFSSPKKLRLAEKRAITQELQQLKWQLFSDEDKTPTSGPTGTPLTAVDSPLEGRKMELVENVSFLDAQVSSAEEYLSQMRRENDLLQSDAWSNLWTFSSEWPQQKYMLRLTMRFPPERQN